MFSDEYIKAIKELTETIKLTRIETQKTLETFNKITGRSLSSDECVISSESLHQKNG